MVLQLEASWDIPGRTAPCVGKDARVPGQPIYCRGTIRLPLHHWERKPAQRSRNNEVTFGAPNSLVADFLGEANSPL